MYYTIVVVSLFVSYNIIITPHKIGVRAKKEYGPETDTYDDDDDNHNIQYVH